MASSEDMTLRVRRKVTEQLYKEVYECNDEDKKNKGPTPKQSAFTFQNICWVVLAVAVFYHTEFIPRAFTHPSVKWTWFYTGCILIGANISIASFLIVYLSYIKKVHSDLWEQHFPAAIPIATACFAFGSFCVTVGLWPIWSFLTPFILFSLFMGAVIIISMLPAF